MTRICPVCQSDVSDSAQACPNCNFRFQGATQEFKPVAAPVPSVSEPAASNMAVLKMVRGPQVGIEYPLNKQEITIGRNPQSDIFLNDMTVSREHAKVTNVAGAYVITDMRSFNGVWLNNKTVDQAALRVGDYLQIGKYDFVYDEVEIDS